MIDESVLELCNSGFPIWVRRKSVWDHSIVSCVLQHNEYEVNDEFTPRDVIIDVGAHVGSFSYLALSRGAGKVFAFEPEPQNYGILVKNLTPFGPRAFPHAAAVWRSDTVNPVLHHTGHPLAEGGVNTGGGNILFGGTTRVQSVSLDDIVRKSGAVRILKLDCEGSEWPILFTSKYLNLITEIVGEYHEIGGSYDSAVVPESARIDGFGRFTVSALQDFLEERGYSFRSYRCGPTNIGKFFAKKR